MQHEPHVTHPMHRPTTDQPPRTDRAARAVRTARTARRRRASGLAVLGVLLVTGLAATGMVGSAGVAGALPPTTDPGETIPHTTTTVPVTHGKINGYINLVNCNVDKSLLSAYANQIMPNPLDEGAFASVRADANGHFTFPPLPTGNFTVTVTTPPCPYGVWNKTSETVHIAPTTVTVSAGTFTYTAPTKVTKVPTTLIEGAVRSTLSTTSMHLNDLGPVHGQSRQLDNSSSVTVGADTFAFTLPEARYALRVCVIWCHTFADARFYVNDINLSSTSARWNTNGLDVTLGFESAGREAKGYLTDSSLNGAPADDLMPDVNIDNASITTRLLPRAVNGRLSYTAAYVAFNGTVQATGPCDLLGFDPCDFFGSYKNDVKTGVQGGASTALNSAMVRSAIESQLASTLAGFGITTVTRVYVDGDNLVLVS